MNQVLAALQSAHVWMSAHPEIVAAVSAAIGAAGSNFDKSVTLLVDLILLIPGVRARAIADEDKIDSLIDRAGADAKDELKKQADQAHKEEPKA